MDEFVDKDIAKRKMFIKRCKSADELIKWCGRTYPNWIYDVLDKYDGDLTSLTENWELVAKKAKVTPQKILLVELVVFESDGKDSKYEIITLLQNILTRYGYCVREKGMFISCITDGCNTAMLNEKLRNSLFRKGECKRVFTNVCLSCMESFIKNNTIKK